MSCLRDVMAPPSDIATRLELDQRLAARVRPTVDRHPSPNPQARLDALRASATGNEDRIAELSATLGCAKAGLDQDFSFAVLKGRSRASFEQSR